MPSIRDLFGDEALDEEGGDAPFDPSNLTDTLNKVLAGRPVAGAPAGYESDAAPLAPQSEDFGGTVDPAATAPAASAPPEAVAAAPAELQPPPAPASAPDLGRAPVPTATGALPTFLDGLSDIELLEMYEIRKALQDPERAVRIKQGYLGIDSPAVSEPPPAPAPTPPEPEPTLPEDVDPDSFEAQLWQQNQDMRKELREFRAAVTTSTQQSAEQARYRAADAAGARFTAKYGDRLSPEELNAVAKMAGAQRLPDAFLAAGDSLDAAFDRALEYGLRSNDVLLGKVLGAPAAPTGPVESPESATRKRTLHALSSAASPAGETPTRQPLSHREDGRLDEKSRLTVVQELVNRMRGSDEGMV